VSFAPSRGAGGHQGVSQVEQWRLKRYACRDTLQRMKTSHLTVIEGQRRELEAQALAACFGDQALFEQLLRKLGPSANTALGLVKPLNRQPCANECPDESSAPPRSGE
jgi:hypothetical protein